MYREARERGAQRRTVDLVEILEGPAIGMKPPRLPATRHLRTVHRTHPLIANPGATQRRANMKTRISVVATLALLSIAFAASCAGNEEASEDTAEDQTTERDAQRTDEETTEPRGPFQEQAR